jgi:preprotein translocase subunit SecE
VTEALGSTATPESGRPDEDEVATKKGRRGGKRAKKGPFGRLALFYRQIIAELRKVVWPTRNQLSTYTSVVIVFVLIMIGIVTVIDYGFNNAIKYVFG